MNNNYGIKLITLSICLVAAQPAQPLQGALQHIKHQSTKVVHTTWRSIVSPKIMSPTIKIIGSALLAYQQASVIESFDPAEVSLLDVVWKLVENSLIYYSWDQIELFYIRFYTGNIIKNNDIDKLRSLLEANIPINDSQKGPLQRIIAIPFLVQASIAGNKDIVGILLEQGADVDAQDFLRRTASYYAQKLPTNTSRQRKDKRAIQQILRNFTIKKRKETAQLICEVLGEVSKIAKEYQSRHDVADIITDYL